jgi:phosphonopyruvate decarboxylase
MIATKRFYDHLIEKNIQFFSGVPDSLLKNICAYISDNTQAKNHIIAANEGNAIALASGYHMATGNIPLVYMQNSGIGNAINPLISLTDEDVYKIPILLMIGWRGDPEVADEPQHVKQGKVTTDLLDAIGIAHLILDKNEEIALGQIDLAINEIKKTNTPFAIIVKKNSFEKYSISKAIETTYKLSREDAIKVIVRNLAKKDLVVSTTGKTSRELFEYRELLNQGHDSDFLTVGSMGHASQIALGIALAKPDRRVACIDGDGALIMHMGGMSIIGSQMPNNLIHIVINNASHESVGGQPTAALNIDLPGIAKANNYRFVKSVFTEAEIDNVFNLLDASLLPAFIEIKVKSSSRDNLGRPSKSPLENKSDFMKNLAAK